MRIDNTAFLPYTLYYRENPNDFLDNDNEGWVGL